MTCKIGSSLYSPLARVATEQHDGQTNLLAVHVGNILSLVTCVQLNVAMLLTVYLIIFREESWTLE